MTLSAVRLIALAPLAAAAAACQTAPETPPPEQAATVTVEPAEDWRAVALAEHASISEDMPPLFARLATADARRRAGPDANLLDPALTLAAPTPAPGPYRCQLLRLPTPAASTRRPRGASRPAFCFVGADGERLSLTLETPARRLGGFLWRSTDRRRLVFLGAAFAPPNRTAPPYSASPETSTAGLFERIGDFRYRLTVRGPVPGTADVYELSAAPAER